MTPHFSTVAWKIPWAKEPGGLQSMGSRLRDFTFTFHFHALEKEMATHSSVLSWRIPRTGKPGRLPSMLVIAFLPRSKCLLISWLQSPSAMILKPPKIKSDTVSTVSPSISHEVMGQIP